MRRGCADDSNLKLESHTSDIVCMEVDAMDDKKPPVTKMGQGRVFLLICLLCVFGVYSQRWRRSHAHHLKPVSSLRAWTLPRRTRPESLPPVTIIMQGYYEERKSFHRELFLRYQNMCGLVAKVIFVWNNVGAPPPEVPAPSKACGISVVVVKAELNSMNNRFLVKDLVETDAVFMVDDDFWFSEDMIRCMLSHWKGDMDRIVGPHARWTSTSGKNAYTSNIPGSYNLILVGGSMFHARFLALYENNAAVQEKVDAVFNGDDILFNAIVQHATQKPPLLVSQRAEFQYGELSAPKESSSVGLSIRSDWNTWVAERIDFVLWAQDHFSEDVFHEESRRGLCKWVNGALKKKLVKVKRRNR